MSKKSFLRVVESSEEFSTGVWRLNSNLVVSKDAVFPDRCIICNEPACGHYMKKTFVWHSPLFLPVIIISFPIYLVLASLGNKILRLDLPVCPKHGNRIQLGTTAGLLLVPQIVVMGLIGLSKGIPFLLLVGILSSIVGLALLMWSRNPVWAWYMRSKFGLIKGAHPDFVNNMPEWDGESI